MSQTTELASAQAINILIVIDTEYVKQTYPNPSKDSTKPTGINHSSQFMICTGSRGIISGQGTADLNFKANVGDYVAFTGTSIYDNADDAVIVYGINYWSGTKVFNAFVPDMVTRTKAVMPDPNTAAGIPPLQTKISFSSLDSKVASAGTENFYVYFGLYTLAADGETQQLFGYYYWDPTVTVG
ncbi:MAG: inclusion body family protein [Sulfuriferula sp.]|jgi:nematocidal protein AidA|nr:inclusion body family protein [Sulfuriferula sp.]